MGVPRGGNAHFKESVYELHKRESHGFSPSVSHRLDHEVSLQGAGRRVAGADTNDYPAAVQRTWRPDRLRRFVARTCPYVRGNPAAYCGQRLRAARQGTLIASGADGVPGLAQALLGAAFLGSGLLLHPQRQHHGRCHTSVSSEARTYRRQLVVIQLRAEFLKIFSRISSQRFSFGLSSGEYGGRKSSEILPGSARSLQRWLGAPSRTKRISCLANFRDRAVRKT